MRHALLLALPCLALAVALPSHAAPQPRRKERLALSEAVGGLQLAAGLASEKVQAGKPVLLEVQLRAVGARRLVVRSHVQSSERHYDYFSVTLRYPTPSREGCRARFNGRGEQRITLVDARDKSAPVAVTLGGPGEGVRHQIDLAAWAARVVNGRKGIAPGFYKVVVRYQVKPEPGVWSGTLEAPPLHLTVEGKPPPGRCPTNPGWDAF